MLYTRYLPFKSEILVLRSLKIKSLRAVIKKLYHAQTHVIAQWFGEYKHTKVVNERKDCERKRKSQAQKKRHQQLMYAELNILFFKLTKVYN